MFFIYSWLYFISFVYSFGFWTIFHYRTLVVAYGRTFLIVMALIMLIPDKTIGNSVLTAFVLFWYQLYVLCVQRSQINTPVLWVEWSKYVCNLLGIYLRSKWCMNLCVWFYHSSPFIVCNLFWHKAIKKRTHVLLSSVARKPQHNRKDT